MMRASKYQVRRLESLSWILGIGLILFPCIALALDESEFQESLKQLRQSQKDTHQKLVKLGVKTHPISPLAVETSSEDSEEESKKRKQKLLVIHDDGKKLRAEAGKFLFGIVYNRLVVGGESSPATIMLSEDQGLFSSLRVLGKARPSGTNDRLAIDIDRIITRKGSVIPVKGVAEDEAGALGLEAQVFSSKALAMAGAMAGSFISGAASLAQSQATSAFGFTQVERTGRNALLGGVAQTAADQSKKFLEDATKEKPILVVEAGTPVTIYIDEEVRF